MLRSEWIAYHSFRKLTRYRNISYNAFHPVYDGQLFKDYPAVLLQKGQWNHANIIAGYASCSPLIAVLNSDQIYI